MDKFMSFAKNVAKVSELKAKKLSRVTTKNDLLFRLGEQVYSQFPTLDVEAINTMIGEAHRLDFEIESLEEAINYAKGLKICKQCGAAMKSDMAFCGKCGAKFEDPVESEEAECKCDKCDNCEDEVPAKDVTDEELFNKGAESEDKDTEA